MSCAVKNIRYVTMSAMNRLDMKDMRPYERLEQIAIEGYSDMLRALGSMPCLEVLYAEMGPLNTIVVPSDFIRYTKVSMFYGNQLVNLGLDTKMPFSSALGLNVCNQPITEQVDQSSGIYYIPHFYNGSFVETLYGIGGGYSIGYYRYNENSRTIEFSANLPRAKVVIEYQSTGQNVNGATAIMPRWVECMRNYVIWQEALFDKDAGLGDKRMFEEQYNNARIRAKLNSLPTLDEFMTALYRGSGFKLR